MSIYYLDTLPAHEHQPAVPAEFGYLNNERQWLLIQTTKTKLAFLRYTSNKFSYKNSKQYRLTLITGLSHLSHKLLSLS